MATARRPATSANGIETFGHTASTAQRSELAGVVRAFLLALSRDDGAAACNRITLALATRLASGPVAAATGGRGGCAGTLTAIHSYQTTHAREALHALTIRAVRIEGTSAFVILAGPARSRIVFYPLRLERRYWRVAAIGPTTLRGGPG